MKNFNNIATLVNAVPACGFAVRPEEGQAGDPLFGRFCVVL